MKPVNGCEECDLVKEMGGDTACLECQLYADEPQEELTPEGVQLVIPGAERNTKPTETERQGALW